MNCQQGDLAYSIRPAVAGQLVRCVAPSVHPITGEPGWQVDPPFRFYGLTYKCALDSILRPIRNLPGEDETLRLVPVPGKPVEV